MNRRRFLGASAAIAALWKTQAFAQAETPASTLPPSIAALTSMRGQARLITNDERRDVETLEKDLVEVKDGDDYRAIRAGIDALNEATMRLAELMMDTAVSTALKGKAMDDTDLEEGPQAGHPVAKADFE